MPALSPSTTIGEHCKDTIAITFGGKLAQTVKYFMIVKKTKNYYTLIIIKGEQGSIVKVCKQVRDQKVWKQVKVCKCPHHKFYCICNYKLLYWSTEMGCS